ncbi:MAG: protoporphyrinogen IX oxidase [Flavobacteriaceae bacterium]|nr:protoporphyrinogen IX oxidase [Flavobacteriaceae bacterium]
MVDYYLYIKALHLIFVITYFAGLFYIPRLMVYLVEAADRPQAESDIIIPQLQLMMRRLWQIITVPSAVLGLIFGLWMLWINPFLLGKSWMLIKLVFVGLLVLYHIKTYRFYKAFLQGNGQRSARFFRIWNEGATLILFAVIFLATLKDSIHWIFGLLGLFSLAFLLLLGIRLYKRYCN